MVLKLIVQRDGSRYASSNCGCVATAHAIAWCTGNKVRRTPDQCRRALGDVWVGKTADPPNDSTSLRDQSRGWATLRGRARKQGLKLPPFDIRLMKPWGDVIDALDAGNAVMLQIDNATLNRLDRRLSGFPGFDGLHVVLLTEIRRQDGGKVQLLDYDGGYDGRVDNETGLRVPRGPQWLPAFVLKEAAEQKNVITLNKLEGLSLAQAQAQAAGTATFAVIARASVIEPSGQPDEESTEEPAEPHRPRQPDRPDPHPAQPATSTGSIDLPDDQEGQDDEDDPEDPPDTSDVETTDSVEELRAALKRTRKALAAARAANEQLEDQNTALENALGIIRTLLADAQGGDPSVTAATQEIDHTLPPPPPVPDGPMDIGVGDEL